MSKTCIILLSHANDEYKDEVLNQCIIGISKLNLPIILVSHTTVSEKNQKLCDFCFVDSNNILLKESDFFNFDLEINEQNLYYECNLYEIKTKNYLRKKNYQGAVINLITNGVQIANYLGYEYGLFWEYDFILNEKSKINLLNILNDLHQNNHDCFYLQSKIKNVYAVYSIPQVFPIKKLLDYNSKIIKNAKDYLDVTKLLCCEQWLYNFYKKLNNPLNIDYNKYKDYFPDLIGNLSDAPQQNPFFSELSSGIFINQNNRNHWIYGICNNTQVTLKYTCKIFFENKQIYFYHKEISSRNFFYNKISESVINEIFAHNKFIEIFEEISFQDITEIFKYKIDNNNFETIYKLKSFIIS
jgi:hypothetical protein